jgi:A/G-specific adenine glycosylase
MLLKRWYAANARDLPWRRTKDPYCIWISEVMLQQTRVSAVIPYYERFIERFPTFRILAEAPESELLKAWSGLGYYSRARNLRDAAQQMVAVGAFPRSYESIRLLAGVGDYTAAAVASIAFGLPRAAVDGNVLRVLARLLGDPGDITHTTVRRRLAEAATKLLDKRDPGSHNQAMMELGATVCVPRPPLCSQCPVCTLCEARKRGLESELPVKSRRAKTLQVELVLYWIERRGALLGWQRPTESRMLAGFWELPGESQAPQAAAGARIGSFRHAITNHQYRVHIVEASVARAPRGMHWLRLSDLNHLPLSTTFRKAVALVNSGR